MIRRSYHNAGGILTVVCCQVIQHVKMLPLDSCKATGAVLCAPISVATVYLFITGETYKSSRRDALFVCHLAAAYVSPCQPLVVCVPWTYNVV